MTASPFSYGSGVITMNEHFKNDLVDSFCVVIASNGTEVDRMTIPALVPASPYSSSGLTVMVDSLFSGISGKKIVRFSAEDAVTARPLFNLTKNNVFLYENDKPVIDYSIMKDTTNGASNLDVVFVLDVTGSMSNEITAVQKNIRQFAASLSTQGVDYRIGMVTFLDNIENTYPFTGDVDQFASFVDQQYAHGGGDEPENSLEALIAATRLSMRKNAKTAFIWITDATYHLQNSYTSLSVKAVVDTLLSRDITVYAVGPANLQTQWYQPIFEPTGGSFFDITGNFQDILLSIASMRFSKGYLATYQSTTAFDKIASVAVEVHAAGKGGFDTLRLASYRPLSKNADGGPLPEASFRALRQGLLQIQNLPEGYGSIDLFSINGKKVLSTHIAPRTGSLITLGTSARLPYGMYLCRIALNDSYGRSIYNATHSVMFTNNK
jgi:Mg-chelatase subunit ChlD